MSQCNSCFDRDAYQLEMSRMGKICKYHKRLGQEFTHREVVKDFCEDAFFHAYPYCLALFYDAPFGKSKGEVRLNCPHPDGIQMEIQRVPIHSWWYRTCKRLFMRWISKVLVEPDWADWNVRVRVTNNSPACPLNYKKGDAYFMNIQDLKTLCPASFHGMYPMLLQVNQGLPIECQPPTGEVSIHCPDHEGQEYKIASPKA